jgi:hypothetical protein
VPGRAAPGQLGDVGVLLADPSSPIGGSKRFLKQFVSVLAQKHQPFGEAHSFSRLALLARKGRLMEALVRGASSSCLSHTFFLSSPCRAFSVTLILSIS